MKNQPGVHSAILLTHLCVCKSTVHSEQKCWVLVLHYYSRVMKEPKPRERKWAWHIISELYNLKYREEKG